MMDPVVRNDSDFMGRRSLLMQEAVPTGLREERSAGTATRNGASSDD